MKKILIFVMIFVLLFNLVGCNNNNDVSNEPSDTYDTSGDRTSHTSDDVVTVYSTDEYEGDTSVSDDVSDSTARVDSPTSSDEMSTSSDAFTDTLKKSFDGDRKTGNQQYQSGQLTAGVWNDNKNYPFFRDVLNDNAWHHMQSYWHFINWERYEFKVINEQEEPLINVTIELHDGNGNIHYKAVTDNHGYAVMYPFLNKVFFQRPEVHARVTIGQHLYEYNNLDIRSSNVLVLEADEYAKPVKSLDMMLVIDTTGSMGDELEYIKAELSDVVSTVKKDYDNDLEVYISANYYRDLQDEYVVRSFPFTNNVQAVLNQMNDQRASGGGDFEEAVVEALNDAIYHHEWDDQADAKLLFLVLDAPPHHTDQNIQQIHTLIRDANEKGIRIIPIASSGIDKNTEFLLRFLSVSTNGTYMFLTDHSGIGNDHLEPTIGFYQVEQLNHLMIKVINAYIE